MVARTLKFDPYQPTHGGPWLKPQPKCVLHPCFPPWVEHSTMQYIPPGTALSKFRRSPDDNHTFHSIGLMQRADVAVNPGKREDMGEDLAGLHQT